MWMKGKDYNAKHTKSTKFAKKTIQRFILFIFNSLAVFAVFAF